VSSGGHVRGRLTVGVIGLTFGTAGLLACGELPDHASGHASVGCYGCHGDRYLASTAPDHVASGFPRTCEGCHSTRAWSPAAFGDHSSWPLTGAHVSTACESCHAGGVYAGTPRECVDCHRPDYDLTSDPPHLASGFPTSCESCHDTTAWAPASFSHDLVWPLVGKHAETSCESCHQGGIYTGTPRECVGCHRPDYDASTNPSHPSLAMPTTCQSCHTPASWESRTYPGHDAFFRISGGDHRFSCESCHLTESWASFTCTGCHTGEHDLAEMNREHADEDGYQATLNQYGVDAGCLHCHPGGRED